MNRAGGIDAGLEPPESKRNVQRTREGLSQACRDKGYEAVFEVETGILGRGSKFNRSMMPQPIKDPYLLAVRVKSITKSIPAGLWTDDYRLLALSALELANCIIDQCPAEMGSVEKEKPSKTSEGGE